jgi:hypothetical protein
LVLGSLAGAVWYANGGKSSAEYFGEAFGAAVFLSIVWRLPLALGKALSAARTKLHEPLFSALEFGTGAALAAGSIMVVIELALGHVRPPGWEFLILPVMAVSFAVFASIGRRFGMTKRL